MAKIPPGARICLTGPECTGKSVLAAALSRHFDEPWTIEFARGYAEARGNELTAADVEAIARGEIALLDRGDRILDTDLISTVVYARHYYGACPQWIEEEARRRRASLYLLMDTDVEWQADNARSGGGEEREDLFDAFRATLEEFETKFVVISGDWVERFRLAIEAIANRAL